MRQAASASLSGLTLPEITTIDAYDREAGAVVQAGITRDELICRVERVMGLQLTYEEGDSASAVFTVKHSSKYRVLQVGLQNGRCTGEYTLVMLDSGISDA